MKLHAILLGAVASLALAVGTFAGPGADVSAIPIVMSLDAKTGAPVTMPEPEGPVTSLDKCIETQTGKTEAPDAQGHVKVHTCAVKPGELPKEYQHGEKPQAEGQQTSFHPVSGDDDKSQAGDALPELYFVIMECGEAIAIVDGTPKSLRVIAMKIFKPEEAKQLLHQLRELHDAGGSVRYVEIKGECAST